MTIRNVTDLTRRDQLAAEGYLAGLDLTAPIPSLRKGKWFRGGFDAGRANALAGCDFLCFRP